MRKFGSLGVLLRGQPNRRANRFGFERCDNSFVRVCVETLERDLIRLRSSPLHYNGTTDALGVVNYQTGISGIFAPAEQLQSATKEIRVISLPVSFLQINQWSVPCHL
jgi:hypothetical protein